MPTHRLSLFLIFLITFKTTQRLTSADPNDEACLTNLHKTLQDPAKNLHNWTKPFFSNPCSGFTSYLHGATCNNNRIYKLSLNNLSLHGSISPYLSNCTNLQSLDLSSNLIYGEIPPELKLLVNLAILNLSSNRLSGQISPELSLCAYLNVIDFHDNKLTGQIPQQFGILSRLTTFDVSKNRLFGKIPASLARFNESSFVGNEILFGYPLNEMKSGKGLSMMAIVGIGLGSGFVSLVISFTGVCIWLKISEKKMEDERGKISRSMPDY